MPIQVGLISFIGFVLVVDIIQITHGIKAESDVAANLLDHIYVEN